MRLVDLLVLLAAAPGAFAFVCRLDRLSFRQHRPIVIVFNLGLAWITFAAGVHAWEGRADLQDIASVMAGLSWAIMSLPSWTAGVPRYMLRPGVQEVPSGDLKHVAGGKQS